jgi:multiple sugar transport system ATP-binding protein
MVIYDAPANTFVASFIGSPAMNLLAGDMADGTFSGENVRVGGLPPAVSGPVTLGFRAEDARVTAPGEGAVAAPVYTFELLGDATLVTVKAGGALVAVKADKTFRAEIGQAVGIAIEPHQCHLFDKGTGERLEPVPTRR